MVTTNQKRTIYTHTHKLLKHTTEENLQTAMVETKRKRNEQIRTTKTTGKQVTKWQ